MRASVFSLTKQTYKSLLRNRNEFLKRTLLPIVSFFVFMFVLEADVPVYQKVVTYAIAMVTISTLMVSWHRLVLLGVQAAGSPLIVRFGVAEAKMFGCLVLFRAITYVADKVIPRLFPEDSIVGSLTSAALGTALMYLLLRLILVYPIIALGKTNISYKAWQASRGIVLKLAGVTLASVFPLAALFLLVEIYVVPNNSESMTIQFAIFYVSAIVIVATALSTVYKELVAVGE